MIGRPLVDLPGDLTSVIEAFDDLGRRVEDAADSTDLVTAVVSVASDVVPEARWISVTRGLAERFTTIASSGPVATRADRLQHTLGTGPCIDAVIGEFVFASEDLALDDRWSSFGPQAVRDLGVRSVVSTRLAPTIDDATPNAGLNLYAGHARAFDSEARWLATLLAVHASRALRPARTSAHLRADLQSRREIGIAVGILMGATDLTEAGAGDVLRIVAQHTHRTVRDVAAEVAATEVPRPSAQVWSPDH